MSAAHARVPTWEDRTEAEDVLRRRTEETVRLKGLLVLVVQGCVLSSSLLGVFIHKIMRR